MKLPLLMERADASIVDEVRARLDTETVAILESIPTGKRVLAYMAEAFLAGLPCSVLTAIAACSAWTDLKRAAAQRDRLLLDRHDLNRLESLAA